MVDIAVSVASKVAECLLAPVGRHCGYVIFSDSYAGELKKELEKVENVRQRVQHSVDEARNNMKPIEPDVTDWVKEVETVANKAHGVLDDEGRAKKTCFCGWLPNPKERHRLGREAKKTVQAIQALIPRGKFERVYYKSAPTGHVIGTPEVNSSASDRGGTITDSRASIFEGIMKALDDEKLKVIGVYGAGGVGKTTLLKEVEKKLRKEGRPFHMIAKSEVSQNPNLKKIQDDIAYALGLDDLKYEPSEVGRRDLLSKRLKDDPTKKVLIILDDLWDELDLAAVGIPSVDESGGCKLLLASRFKDVMEQKMLADQTFHLEGLNNGEAFRLFEKKVGDRLKNEELKAIAAQVVEKLAGLPLLINSVASTLKYGSESTWRIYSKKIEEPTIEKIVKLSYDHLEREETKSLFLLCGLIGGTIDIELLLGLGMGLGLFEGFGGTMKESRDRLNVMLDSLRSACLLLDGGDDKKNVTIHDLYSEVVVSTPFGGRNSLRMNSNDGSWPKEKLVKCWAICLVNVVGDRLVELMQGECPDLKILMLSQTKNRYKKKPGQRLDVEDFRRLDFAYKKELRVLYLRSMHFSNLPPSIEILENLRSLYLNECDVEDVTILSELKALQILSFAQSGISRLPKEIGKLTKLKSLNLSYCWKLQKIEPGVLKGLINLEELYMQRSFYQWMSEDGISSELCTAKLAELKSSTKLTALEISIPDPTVLLKDGDLPFGNLIRFWINIGRACVRKFEGLTSMMLNLEGCDDILSKEWVQKTLQKTQCLLLDGLRDSKKSAHELCSRGFPKLKHLDIRNCSSIKQIVSSSDGAFPILESLFLENLINLDKISDGPECFSQLKVIEVNKCDRLESLWRLAKMPKLAQLEEIMVHECDSIQAIVIDDERKDAVVAENRVEWPNLRHLKLDGLPKMTSLCIEAGITSDGAPIQVRFPRLESLVMVGLLDLEKILYGQPPSECSNLKSIKIRESKSMSSSILMSDWILKLPNLESLIIESSPSAEVVFDLEELKGTGHNEILSRLMELRLSNLPNLQRMCKENAQLKGISVFRKLKELHVSNARLAFLFPISVAKCLREIRSIKVRSCGKMEALVVDEDGRDEGTNDIIEFPLLEQLSIYRCPMIKSFSYFRGKKESVPITSDSRDAYSDSFFDPKVSLPSLKQLVLWSIGSFKSIWPRELPQSSFDNLAELRVGQCSELPNVFPLSIMGRLHNLRLVEIRRCPSLETVFECGPLESNTTEQTGVVPVSKAIRLRNLELMECENLQRIAPSDVWKRLQRSLEILKVKSCRSIEIIYDGDAMVVETGKLRSLVLHDLENLRHIWWYNSLPNISVPFPNLMDIEVVRCPRLTTLFETFTASFLGQIKWLEVVSCDDMELIADHGECEGATCTTTTFSKLDALKLKEMPKFKGYLPEKYHVEFPSHMRAFIREGCGKEPDQSDGSDLVGWKRDRVLRRLRAYRG